MNRRNAIGNIMALSIGAFIIPACEQNDVGVLQFKNFSLALKEEKIMEQLAESIIPKTDFIGAADLKAHEFTLRMVDDCFEPDQQKKYTAGLKAFEQLTKAKFGDSFTSISTTQKKEWVGELEKKKDLPDNVHFFYQTTKMYTVQSFTSSKEYMLSVLQYKMVPGSSFKGCVPLKKG